MASNYNLIIDNDYKDVSTELSLVDTTIYHLTNTGANTIEVNQSATLPTDHGVPIVPGDYIEYQKDAGINLYVRTLSKSIATISNLNIAIGFNGG